MQPKDSATTDAQTVRCFLEKHSDDPYVTSEVEAAFNRIVSSGDAARPLGASGCSFTLQHGNAPSPPDSQTTKYSPDRIVGTQAFVRNPDGTASPKLNIYVELVSAQTGLGECTGICGHLPQFSKAQQSINRVVAYLDEKIRKEMNI